MDVPDWIKVIVSKLNINIFIFSCLVALLIYALLEIKFVWFLISLLACYLLSLGICRLISTCVQNSKQRKYFDERNRMRVQEEENIIKRYNTIFESLSDETKRILIELYRYKKPEGGTDCQRVLLYGTKLNREVSSVCCQLNNTFWNLELLQEINSIGSNIVTIDVFFLEVLKEKSKTFNGDDL